MYIYMNRSTSILAKEHLSHHDCLPTTNHKSHSTGQGRLGSLDVRLRCISVDRNEDEVLSCLVKGRGE